MRVRHEWRHYPLHEAEVALVFESMHELLPHPLVPQVSLRAVEKEVLVPALVAPEDLEDLEGRRCPTPPAEGSPPNGRASKHARQRKSLTRREQPRGTGAAYRAVAEKKRLPADSVNRDNWPCMYSLGTCV
jgi:hypothetical protein